MYPHWSKPKLRRSTPKNRVADSAPRRELPALPAVPSKTLPNTGAAMPGQEALEIARRHR